LRADLSNHVTLPTPAPRRVDRKPGAVDFWVGLLAWFTGSLSWLSGARGACNAGLARFVPTSLLSELPDGRLVTDSRVVHSLRSPGLADAVESAPPTLQRCLTLAVKHRRKAQASFGSGGPESYPSTAPQHHHRGFSDRQPPSSVQTPRHLDTAERGGRPFRTKPKQLRCW